MVYTTYISNMKNIPQDAKKILIMRYIPKSLKDDKYNLMWMPDLAPQQAILNQYKNNEISFEDLTLAFKRYLVLKEEAKIAINKLKDMLSKEDVYLICCEKDSSICHRTILKEYLISLGYKGEEM